jgi:outer membrane protein assembly factor BamD (BamD/ComL family)
MTVASIFSTLLNSGAQPVQSQSQNQNQTQAQGFQQEFQQLGQDLQTGNLSAAQSDFATLQQSGMLPSSTTAAATGNSIAQEFNQLSQDLKAGKLSSAQQDYAALKQDFQSHSIQHRGHHHYQSNSTGSDPVSQLMEQLGQALQTGNLTSAQQAYSTLQQEFQQFAQVNALGSSATSGSGTLSVNA